MRQIIESLIVLPNLSLLQNESQFLESKSQNSLPLIIFFWSFFVFMPIQIFYILVKARWMNAIGIYHHPASVLVQSILRQEGLLSIYTYFVPCQYSPDVAISFNLIFQIVNLILQFTYSFF